MVQTQPEHSPVTKGKVEFKGNSTSTHEISGEGLELKEDAELKLESGQMDIKGPIKSTGKLEVKGTVRLDSPKEDRRIDLNGTLSDIQDEEAFKTEFKDAVRAHLGIIDASRVEVTKLDDTVGAGSRRRLTSLESEFRFVA